MLVGTELRYTPLEKLCLSLYVACTKLKYYIRTRDVVILCAGIGLLIISPGGVPTKLSFKTNTGYSNNETEYQALITGLEILKELGAKNVVIRGDSQLVIKQLTREYKCLNEKLVEFKTRAVQLLDTFGEVELQHIPRDSNLIANELAQIASGYKISKECLEYLIHTESEVLDHREILSIGSTSQQDWRSKLIEYLRNPNIKVEKKIKLQALNYVLLNNELYKRGFDGVLFKCLGDHGGYIAMAEIPEGICGAHQGGKKMKWVLSRKGLYWPTMIKYCIKFAKRCEECQKHGPIQKVPASELHSIIKPWPFRGWAMDLIGQIHLLLVTFFFGEKQVRSVLISKLGQFLHLHVLRGSLPQVVKA
uniref:Uncharacterized protein Mb2253c family n=1 Tax=Cajanus cajan TaxID=3821 RepID=A0A151S8W8_CAJCA|nr:Uncharacterized protein Mb2253c family [Cajanus cajan]